MKMEMPLDFERREERKVGRRRDERYFWRSMHSK